MNLEKLRKAKHHMAAKTVGKDTVLVPLKENVAELSEMFTLNEVGSFIWAKLDSVEAGDELVNAVVAEFDIDTKTAEADVAAFITELEVFIVRN